MNVDRYLDRLDLDRGDVAAADAAALDRLQRAHVRTVPFENLSIVGEPFGDYRGDPLSLALPDLYEKLVERERGGLCFELNGLFAWLLDALGFDVRRLAGRVYTADGALGELASHLTIVVAHDEPYVADVGFGDIVRGPIPLDGTARETVDGGWRAVERDRPGRDSGDLERDDRDGADRERDASDSGTRDYEVQYRAPGADDWTPRYVFADIPCEMGFFEDAVAYHESDPEAPFTGDPVVAVATDRGRKTLSRNSLTVTEGREKPKQPIDPDAWRAVLEREFGVALDRA